MAKDGQFVTLMNTSSDRSFSSFLRYIGRGANAYRPNSNLQNSATKPKILKILKYISRFVNVIHQTETLTQVSMS